jgi:hypothetical protein
MRPRQLCIRIAGAGLLALAGATALAEQPAPVLAEGISDVGSFEQVPYRLEPQLMLRAEDKLTLRRLEDKHIAELRAMEDRFERDLRALRAKQQSEREALLKGFSAKR